MTDRRHHAPLYMTLVLFLLTVLTFFTLNGRVFPDLELPIVIGVYIVWDVGLVIALIWGLFSKDKLLKLFSFVANIGLIIPLSIWIFLLLLANGISET